MHRGPFGHTGIGLTPAYRENVLISNNSAGGGVQVTGGINMGADSCNGVTCP